MGPGHAPGTAEEVARNSHQVPEKKEATLRVASFLSLSSQFISIHQGVFFFVVFFYILVILVFVLFVLIQQVRGDL